VGSIDGLLHCSPVAGALWALWGNRLAPRSAANTGSVTLTADGES